MGSRASSSSAVLSSLASMDLALGFLPHKPIKKREKGERVYAEREREREGEGNPVVYYRCVQPPLHSATRMSHTSVTHTGVTHMGCPLFQAFSVLTTKVVSGL